MSGAPLDNFFAALPAPSDAEEFTELLAAGGLRIERIVSTGQATPPGIWLAEPAGEWVMVLQGAASLSIAGEAAPRRLGAGDFLNLPPHTRHRVDWTDPDQPTLWLAVHYTT